MSNQTVNTPSRVHHFRRLTFVWIIVSVVADIAFWIWVAPHMPPGTLTETAANDARTFNVLMVASLPVLLGVWIYLGYALYVWNEKRNKDDVFVGREASHNKGVQTSWIVITSVAVLILAGYGTYALLVEHGAGGGEGPNPAWAVSGALKAETAALTGKATWAPGSPNVLPVQVIGQQWEFTYRYPTFGGFESSQLIIPAHTSIAFNVTSLDVIHSFWAYQLGVKADANPQVNDVAFTETKNPGNFTVRCSELCGIWHGAMYNSGKVLSQTDFENWATTTEANQAANTALLPAFAWTYVPDANGAAGSFYPDGTLTPYSTVETYGAKQPS
jgi:cytochrome c oxidase subunit II